MTDSQNNCAIIILAAGASTRLGSPKQLAKIGEKYLLEYMVENALKTDRLPVIVVLGAYFEKIKKSIEHLPVHILENKNWESGMGSTIACGVNFLENNFPEVNGTIIMLSDQPFVTPSILLKIEEKAKKNEAPICAAKYADTIGPPAFFKKNIFPELKNLTGQKGAKPIFQKYRNELVTIDFPKGEFDVDRPEDVKKLKIFEK